MPDQLREALEKAFDDTSPADEAPAADGGESAPVETAVPAADAPVAAPAAKSAPKATPTSPGQAAKAAREAAAAAIAKPAASTKPALAAAQAPPEAATATDPAIPRTRAPGSWTPALREKWGALPDDVRDHITKREAEITSQLTSTASARKLADQFVSTIRPYEQLIRSSRVSPIQAVQSLMNTAATLQMGTSQQKAQIVADIVRNYGLDIGLLDQVLSGQVKKSAGPEAAIERMLNQRLAPVQQLLERFQQNEQAGVRELAQEAAGELEAFTSKPESEFLDDVREEMADLLEVAAKRGRELTLEQAYEIACTQNAQIKQIRDQRADAARIASGGGVAARARTAAASLPAGAPPAGGGSVKPGHKIRDALNSAFDELSSR